MTAATIGRPVVGYILYLGELAFLVWETILSLFCAPLRWGLTMRQIVEVGFRSQLVVFVTGGFTGAVFAAQTFYQFNALGMESAVGPVVSVSLFRELGPVLTALMVSGRVGAAIAAEIGTMKVTEQIDALRALGIHPIDYLVLPRVLAMMVSMPLLVMECIVLGISAGWLVGTKVLAIPHAFYWANTVRYTEMFDIIMALSKGFVFATIIVFISCLEGMRTSQGAAGVGRAPTQAVVNSSLTVLISNFFLSIALNLVMGAIS